MRRGVVVWMGGAFLLAGLAVAAARAERDLTDDELRAEMAQNKGMAAYIARNGMPDIAETHFLADKPPWDDHEVTLYYLDARKEIGFARASILGRPIVQIERYERALTDKQVAALSARARARRGAGAPAAAQLGAGAGPVERAEDAARRAEDAAGRVEQAADATERAAERAESVVARMESAFHRSLRK